MARLQNSSTLRLSSPTQALPAFPLFQTILASTDWALCVALTCFLSTGAPNSTSRPPWITNTPLWGHSLHTAWVRLVFLLDFRLNCYGGSLSQSRHLSVCVYCLLTYFVIVCVYFTDTTPRHGSPLWLTLQRTSDSKSSPSYRAK